jgi:hypothetical protein
MVLQLFIQNGVFDYSPVIITLRYYAGANARDIQAPIPKYQK